MKVSWINKGLVLLLWIPLGMAFSQEERAPEVIEHPGAFGIEAFADLFTQLRAYQFEEVSAALPHPDLSDNLNQVLKAWIFHQKGAYSNAATQFEKVDLKDPDLGPFLVNRISELLITGSTLQKFQVHETEHFSIRYQSGRDSVFQYLLPEILERAYDQYGSLFQFSQDEKIIVEIMPDYRLFSYASALTKQQIETTGTVALCVENRLVALTPRRVARGYYWPDVLAHEFVHYILTKISANHAPLWYQEGVAKYLEQRWEKNEASPLDKMMEAQLAEALEKDQFVTIEQMYPSFAALPTAELAQLAYAQTTSMVDYMSHKAGEEIIARLGHELATSDEFDKLLSKHLQMDVEGLQREWKQWAHTQGYSKHGQFEFGGVTLLDKDEAPDALSQLDMEDLPKKHTRLGDLLLERHRYNPALKEYMKAIDKQPHLPRQMLLRILNCYEHLNRFRDSIELIDRHVMALNHDATMLKYKALACLRLKQYVQAEELLTRAMRINPFDPSIFTMRQELFEATDNEQKAKQTALILDALKRKHVTKESKS